MATTRSLLDRGRPDVRAIFLDRDGVLNVDHGYTYRIEDLQLHEGVGETLAELKRRGYLLIVVTNQSGVARGYYTMHDVDRFHEAMQALLSRDHDLELDAFYVCPDAPDTPSTRRKPAPGMVLEAIADFGIDRTRSYLVGDKDSDVACAVAAGVRAIHVTDGAAAPGAIASARSLRDSLRWIAD